jgi:hypothetical protein
MEKAMNSVRQRKVTFPLFASVGAPGEETFIGYGRPQHHEALLAEAKRALAAFRDRYSSVEELMPLLRKIDKVLAPTKD